MKYIVLTAKIGLLALVVSMLLPSGASWFIDLLNINLNTTDLEVASTRIQFFMAQFKKDGSRITENIDF